MPKNEHFSAQFLGFGMKWIFGNTIFQAIPINLDSKLQVTKSTIGIVSIIFSQRILEKKLFEKEPTLCGE